MQVAIVDTTGLIGVYDTTTLDLVLSPFKAHTNKTNHIKLSPYNSSIIVTCSDDYTVKIWNLYLNWTLIRNYTGHSSMVTSFDFIDEDTIVSGSYDGSIKIWSISTGVTLKTIVTGYNLRSLKILNNGFYLAASWGIGAYVYNMNDGQYIKYLYNNYGYIQDFVLLDNNLVASTDDEVINIWDYRTSPIKINTTLNGHSDKVYGLKLVSTDVLASASLDATIKLWNITSGTLIRT